MSLHHTPLPCPICGHYPRLITSVKGDRYSFKYECRKWLGLKRCFGPQDPTIVTRDWAEVGQHSAVRMWNDEVEHTRFYSRLLRRS